MGKEGILQRCGSRNFLNIQSEFIDCLISYDTIFMSSYLHMNILFYFFRTLRESYTDDDVEVYFQNLPVRFDSADDHGYKMAYEV